MYQECYVALGRERAIKSDQLETSLISKGLSMNSKANSDNACYSCLLMQA